jgi:chromosome segregation ATPase
MEGKLSKTVKSKELSDPNGHAESLRASLDLIASMTSEMDEVHLELSRLSTNYLPKLKHKNGDIRVATVSKKREMLNMIKSIKSKQVNYEERIQKLQKIIDNTPNTGKLYAIIQNLKSAQKSLEMIIDQKKEEINDLIALNKDLVSEIENLDIVIKSKNDTIKEVRREIELMELKLNKKYVFLVSRKNALVSKFSNNEFLVPYPKRKIDVLSEHSEKSYRLVEHKGRTSIVVIDSVKFWRESNNLIVRINKRSI